MNGGEWNEKQLSEIAAQYVPHNINHIMRKKSNDERRR